jgi:predicted GTPase
MSVLTELRPLLGKVIAACTDPAQAADLRRLEARLDQPLIVAIAGKVKAGKSTLLNALIGEQLAPTDSGECTQVVTWYQNGPTYRVVLHLHDGSSRQAPFRRDDGALQVDLGGIPHDKIARMVVDWPSSRLATMSIIDTPGLDSVSKDTSQRTLAFLGLADEGEGGEADAVVYLMRHVHRTDLGFLEAFRDDAQATASPINSIAVLSRADEVGACRLDAMASARRIAESWRSDTRLKRLCQTVVPVAGLIAETGATLREDEYRTLAALAAMPRPQLDAMLLTTDRFVNDDTCPVTRVEREDLLARLGVFGVRLSVSLIRVGGVSTAALLASELKTRSGVEELRVLLTTVLAERRDVLKARVALVGLDAALRSSANPAFEPLRHELERIVASAHEFDEVHLLNAVRCGALAFRPAEIDELERLLGNIGASPAVRMGLAGSDDARTAALAGVERWRRRAENPITPLDLSDAARAVARTYEALLAESR